DRHQRDNLENRVLVADREYANAGQDTVCYQGAEAGQDTVCYQGAKAGQDIVCYQGAKAGKGGAPRPPGVL
ncbi:hypothetical protein AVEN_162782-1, partial [Araneus ventricosus]